MYGLGDMDIKKFVFSNFNLDLIKENTKDFYNYPVVYIIKDKKELYVGETTKLNDRTKTHLKDDRKNKLKDILYILDDRFNKSVALDFESRLIRYFSAAKTHVIINSNLGLTNHNYFQKNEVYDLLFNDVWEDLKNENIVSMSLKEIENLDAFKFSPYKTLNSDQYEAFECFLDFLISDITETLIVKGGAGTGKTVLAIYLMKFINDLNLKLSDFSSEVPSTVILKLAKIREKYNLGLNAGLVVPMQGLRASITKSFDKINGLKKDMVLSPSDVSKHDFDILIVDESHRLKRREKLSNYKVYDDACERLGLDKNTADELDFVLNQSKKRIFFYDGAQTVKPSDVSSNRFHDLMKEDNVMVMDLITQMRVKGGEEFVRFVNDALDSELNSKNVYDFGKFDFRIYDSFIDFFNAIKSKDTEYGLCRAVAGYSWDWDRNNVGLDEIEIEGVKVSWNTTGVDWIGSKNSVNEIGCIHTTQGYDLNYVGVIFGNEITYDDVSNKIEIISEEYKDKNGKPRQGVNSHEILKDYIVNIYKTLMLRGMNGVYIYCCDKKLRDYFKSIKL